MPTMFRHEGGAIDYVPDADVAAGTVIVLGELVGVARLDIKAGGFGEEESVTCPGVRNRRAASKRRHAEGRAHAGLSAALGSFRGRVC